jgi:hypothetical protein
MIPTTPTVVTYQHPLTQCVLAEGGEKSYLYYEVFCRTTTVWADSFTTLFSVCCNRRLAYGHSYVAFAPIYEVCDVGVPVSEPTITRPRSINLYGM